MLGLLAQNVVLGLGLETNDICRIGLALNGLTEYPFKHHHHLMRRQAFYRIRMNPESEDLTSFKTRHGTFKYKVMPFGLCNGPATFQRYINDVLFDLLDECCTAYIGDILIFSEDPLMHGMHVKKVLQRPRETGLEANTKKRGFSVTKTRCLGFIIGTDGLQVDPQKVAAVTCWKEPKSVKGI